MIPPFGTLPGERRGYADAGGGQVHYRVMGDGPAVLLLHQAPWAGIQYRRIMPLLAARGYRAIAPDLPGHGLSDPVDPPRVEDFAAAALAVVDQLGIDRFAVAGQHGGAAVAVRTAAVAGGRVAAVALDNPPFYTADERTARSGQRLGQQAIEPGGAHFTDRWASVRKRADPKWSDETVHVAVLTYFANGPTREDMHHAVPSYDLATDLSRIDCPGLVIAGRDDSLFAHADRLAEARPDWTRLEVAAGAALLFDRPETWVGHVADFFETAGWPRAQKSA